MKSVDIMERRERSSEILEELNKDAEVKGK
jgi:hypothetical protein